MKTFGFSPSARLCAILAGLAILAFVRAATAAPPAAPPDSVAEARAVIREWMGTLKDLAGKPYRYDGEIPALQEERLARVFPRETFFVLHFGEWPIARSPWTKDLSARNVFAVGADRSLTCLRDARGLEDFFRKALPPADPAALSKDPSGLRDAVYAWLRLSQEFSQDGFFRFTIPEEGIHVEERRGGFGAWGDAVVQPTGGNFGRISATFTFTENRGLAQVIECRQVIAGIRPICQALKLLDPDPVVREMARQALLVMGRSAEGYLKERRSEASPELRTEIDKVWAQIVAEGR